MCDARCKRSGARRLGIGPQPGAHRDLAGGFAAAFGRRKIGSPASRNLAPRATDSRFPSNPKPRGLTIPAATTATRRLVCPIEALNVRHCTRRSYDRSRFLLLSTSKHFTNDSETESAAWKLVDCQLSLFSGDLKSDKREQ